TGSVMIPESAAPLRLLLSEFTVSQVNRPVSPRLTTAKMTSVHGVDRTERIFVHSPSSTPPKPVRRAGDGAGRAVARAGGLTGVSGCCPAPRDVPLPAPRR